MHFLEENNNEDKKIKYLKNLGISIFFSTQNNKESNTISQFYKENKDENNILKKYSLTEILNLDLNKYVNFNDSYYYYKGSGTFPI